MQVHFNNDKTNVICTLHSWALFQLDSGLRRAQNENTAEFYQFSSHQFTLLFCLLAMVTEYYSISSPQYINPTCPLEKGRASHLKADQTQQNKSYYSSTIYRLKTSLNMRIQFSFNLWITLAWTKLRYVY